MEKIISIEEKNFETRNPYRQFTGYIITTTEQIIKVGIESEQQCCECWGYLIMNDSVDDFIGSELVDVRIVDTSLNNRKIDEIEGSECSAIFVNLETSKGTMQIVAYNDHNGFYGHLVTVISDQLKFDVEI